MISRFFKVDDEYSSELDRNLCAHSSLFKTHEGSRQRETRITFDQERKKASYLERDTVKNAVLSSRRDRYSALCDGHCRRALSHADAQSGTGPDRRKLAVSDGKKSAFARVDAQRRETVKTPPAAYKTVRYEAYLFNDVIYRRPGRVFIWLTDDSRRLPVQIQVRLQLAIGTITLQLEKEGT